VTIRRYVYVNDTKQVSVIVNIRNIRQLLHKITSKRSSLIYNNSSALKRHRFKGTFAYLILNSAPSKLTFFPSVLVMKYCMAILHIHTYMHIYIITSPSLSLFSPFTHTRAHTHTRTRTHTHIHTSPSRTR